MSGTNDANDLYHAIPSILFWHRQGVAPSCIGREESYCTSRRHPCIGVYIYARPGPASDSDAGFLFFIQFMWPSRLGPGKPTERPEKVHRLSNPPPGEREKGSKFFFIVTFRPDDAEPLSMVGRVGNGVTGRNGRGFEGKQHCRHPVEVKIAGAAPVEAANREV